MTQNCIVSFRLYTWPGSKRLMKSFYCLSRRNLHVLGNFTGFLQNSRSCQRFVRMKFLRKATWILIGSGVKIVHRVEEKGEHFKAFHSQCQRSLGPGFCSLPAKTDNTDMSHHESGFLILSASSLIPKKPSRPVDLRTAICESDVVDTIINTRITIETLCGDIFRRCERILDFLRQSQSTVIQMVDKIMGNVQHTTFDCFRIQEQVIDIQWQAKSALRDADRGFMDADDPLSI